MPVSIELFGVKGYVYDAIRALLIEHLDDAGIDYVIEDHQEIDEFIKEGIDSVPTIRINRRTQFTKTDEITTEDLVTAVGKHVIELGAPKIVCPVDFSPHSLQAAAWAAELAHLLHMQLKLVHIVRPMSEISFGEEAAHSELLSHLTKKLDQIANDLGATVPSISPATSVEVGDPLQTIVRLSKAPSTAFIVMGTQGTTSLRRRLFGTVSSAVTRHTYAPVMLIPPDLTLHKPERILVAFHDELVSNGALRTLLDLNDRLRAHLRFLHINDNGDYQEIRDKLVTRLVDAGFPRFSFEVHDTPSLSSSVLQTLLSYAEQTQPDMIVFVTRHRNIIRNLVPVGMTRQVQRHLHWPLLVLHNM